PGAVRPVVLEDEVQPQGRRSAGSWSKKASTPSTRGRGHATEQDCKSETGTVQLRMNPMPLPLRHGRARGACRPRGIMSGSRRPPCRLTASRGRMPASPEGRPRRKITIEAKSDGMPRRETTRGTESRSPSPLAFGRTRKDNVQGLRPFHQIKQESTAFHLNRKSTFFTPSYAFIHKATISCIPFPPPSPWLRLNPPNRQYISYSPHTSQSTEISYLESFSWALGISH